MSKKKDVNVTVNLRDKFSGTLGQLKTQLKEIDRMVISPTFKIKGTKQVEDLKLSMETIDDVINTLFEIIGEGDINQLRAKIESLPNRHNLKVNVRDGEVTRAIAKQKLMSRNEMLRLPNLNSGRGNRPMGGISGMDFDHISRNRDRLRANANRGSLGIRKRQDLNQIGERLRHTMRKTRMGITAPDPETNFGDGTTKSSKSSGSDSGSSNRGRNRRRRSRGLGMLIPSGAMSNQISSIVMAITAALSTALGGAITAFGGTLLAGGAIGGLGILGFGENAADSLHLAQVRLRLFGRELFKVFKPASKHFAPFVDQMFQRLPHELGQLVGTFQQLDVFIPTLGQVGTGFIDWVDRAFQSMTRLEPIISQLTLRFGGLIGDGLIDLFEWLTIEFYENQEALLAIMVTIKSLVVMVIRLAQVWAQMFVVLRPLFDLIAAIAGVLNNRWIVALLQVILVMAVWTKVTWGVIKALAIMKAMAGGSMFLAMIGPIMKATGAMYAYAASIMGATKAKALLMSLTGVGAVVAAVGAASAMGAVERAAPDLGGSGMPATAPGGGNAGPTINNYSTYNVGDGASNSDIQRIKDISKDGTEEYLNTQERMNR